METSTTFSEREKVEQEKSNSIDLKFLSFISILTIFEVLVYYAQNTYFEKLFGE